jgi:uncharacterized membrane-anchored protein
MAARSEATMRIKNVAVIVLAIILFIIVVQFLPALILG